MRSSTGEPRQDSSGAIWAAIALALLIIAGYYMGETARLEHLVSQGDCAAVR